MDFVAGIANLIEHSGIQIALTGMIVVFVALSVISLLIAFLSQMVARLEAVLPEVSSAPRKKTRNVSDDEAVAVAVALSFHQNSSAS